MFCCNSPIALEVDMLGRVNKSDLGKLFPAWYKCLVLFTSEIEEAHS